MRSTRRRSAEPTEARTTTRGELADRLVTPWWYHPVLAAAVAFLTLSWTTGKGVVVLAAVAVYGTALVVLPRLYRRTTGVWVTGLPQRRARRWGRRLGWACAGAVFLGIVSSVSTALWPLGVGAAVAVSVLVPVLGRRFDEELRAELREDPHGHLRLEERPGR